MLTADDAESAADGDPAAGWDGPGWAGTGRVYSAPEPPGKTAMGTSRLGIAGPGANAPMGFRASAATQKYAPIRRSRPDEQRCGRPGLPMQCFRHAPPQTAPVRRSDLSEGERAAGLALTIQIVARQSRRHGDAAQSHSRGRSLGDGVCGAGPLARYRLAPSGNDATDMRHHSRCSFAAFALAGRTQSRRRKHRPAGPTRSQLRAGADSRQSK